MMIKIYIVLGYELHVGLLFFILYVNPNKTRKPIKPNGYGYGFYFLIPDGYRYGYGYDF